MKRSRTVVPWGCVALAALGLIGLPSTGQTQLGDNRLTAVAATTELPDSPGAMLAGNISTSTSDAPDAPTVSTRDLESTSVVVQAPKYYRVVRPYEEAGPL